MAEKESSFLTDKSASGRFKRALSVALPSIALARNDPYLVKSLYDKEAEFGKLDRDDARDLIKSSASSITDLINKNKTKRTNRIESNLETLTALKGEFPELENADVALIQKRGMGNTLKNIKKKFNLDRVDSILNIVKENIPSGSEDITASKVPNMTLSELAEAMAPAAKNLELQMNQVRSAPASGPITSFVSGEMFSDEKGVDLSPQIQNIVKSSDVTSTVDTEDTKKFKEFLDSNKDIFTEAGKQARRVASLSAKEDIGEERIAKVAEATIAKRLGLSVSINTLGDVTYAPAAKKYEQVVPRIAQLVKEKALQLKIDGAKLDDPRFYTNQSAIDKIINDNFAVEGDKEEGKGKERPQGFILKQLQDVGLEKGSSTKTEKKDKTKKGTMSVRELKAMYVIALNGLKAKEKKEIEEVKNSRGNQSMKNNKIKTIQQSYKVQRATLRANYRSEAVQNNLDPDLVAP